MHGLTKKDIEKCAVLEFISYFEEQMNMVISQSAKELDRKNKMYQNQGIKQKRRIGLECVKNAIKTINNNGHSSASERAGGKFKKESETHSQENTEVA